MADRAPLTQAQKGVLIECLGMPESTGYNLPAVTRMSPDTDADRFAACVKRMLSRHRNFRTRISIAAVEQYFCPEEIDVPVLDMPEGEVDAFVHGFIRPFELDGGPLFRTAVVRTGSYVYWITDSHHTITDGTTQFLAASEVAALYDGREVAPEKVDFIDYALSSPECGSEASREYYRNLYEGLSIPRLKARQADSAGETVSVSEYLPCSVVDSICTPQTGFSPSIVFHAAYALTLHIWQHDRTVCFSTLSSGRVDRRIRGTFGMLIKTFPVLRIIDPSQSVRDFILGFKSELLSEIRHSDYSFLEFCSDRGFVPETMFAFQGPAILESLPIGGGVACISQPHNGGRTNFNLSTVIYQKDGRYEIRLECSDAIHDRGFIADFARTVATVTESLCSHTEGLLSEVSASSLASPLAGEALTGAVDVVSKIRAAAARYPDKTAVSDGSVSLTYSELVARAEDFAAILKNRHAGGKTSICICQTRSCNIIVRMLGALFADCCYIPVDPDTPRDRLDFILRDSSPAAVVRDDGIEWRDGGCRNSSHLAYVIYTSGSTGRPKGVEVSRRALSSFVEAISRVLGIGPDDRIGCHSSFSFDASVEDIYPVLCAGGTLIVVPEDLRRDPAGLCGFLRDNAVTGGNYTTRFGQMLLGEFDLPVRYLVLGGEKMTGYPRRNRSVRVFNTYGPTEFTVDATWFELNPDAEYDDIPIGHPLPGVTAYVCDTSLNPVPAGVTGELCLSGEQMAQGYRGLPEVTAASFVKLSSGERCYRTGDIVRCDSDGLLHFIGRNDGQVKVRGFRIETGEVEAAMAACHGVRQAAVKCDETCASLVAFYEGEASDGAIREKLSESLPSYMIPDSFVRLDAIPLTSNGKTDYAALRCPSRQGRASVVLPSGPRETALYDIACRILGHDSFGVTDDLYLEGLGSLGAITFQLESSRAGYPVKTRDIVQGRTIRAIAAAGAEVMTLYGEDSGPDTFVLVCGVTWMEDLRPLCSRLASHHTLYVIEPVSDHMGGDDTAETLVERYLALVRGTGRTIAAVYGHSFGGELAAMLSRRLSEVQDSSPALVMLDTSLSVKVPRNVDSLVKRLPSAQRDYWTTFISRSRPAVALHKESHFGPYGGPSTLFYAIGRLPNALAMQRRIPGLRLVPVHAGHMEMLEEKFVGDYE